MVTLKDARLDLIYKTLSRIVSQADGAAVRPDLLRDILMAKNEVECNGYVNHFVKGKENGACSSCGRNGLGLNLGKDIDNVIKKVENGGKQVENDAKKSAACTIL